MAKAKINQEFTYKTRDGQEVTDVGFTGVNGDDPYVVCASIDGYPEFYTERGHYYKGQIHSLDLIKQPVKKVKPVVKETQEEIMKNTSTPEVVQHIHHDMIVAWAKNPSQQVQSKTASSLSWYDTEFPEWRKSQEYRFKPEEPKLLTIIGADGKARSYPEPYKVKPKYDTVYYCPDVINSASSNTWWNDSADNEWFRLGLIHITKEAAELHAKAMLGID
jgi:hypothetical protein